MSRAWLLLCVLASGCYTVKFHDGELESAGAQRGRTVQLWTHSLFWGLIPITSADLSACHDGVLRMKSEVGGLGLLAYALTGGLWTPMHVKLVCADPPGPGAKPVGAAAEPELAAPEDSGISTDDAGDEQADAPTPAVEEPPPTGGCTKDLDCKGDRVCEDARCVEAG